MKIDTLIGEHLAVIEQVRQHCIPSIEKMVSLCKEAVLNGRTVFFCGNGGSAADSQHLAAEFVGRFVKERRGLAAVALTTDTSILTAVSNDYGYEQMFSRQVEALVRAGDVLIGLSTSGNSQNVILAIHKAKQLGAITIGLSGGNGGKMVEACDVCITVPDKVTARIQEAHILIGHILCEIMDEVTS
ncbi:D-sedoheptulose-7-phosphate isomerase [Pelosinus propionicus]|uniref:Phosphoheptose isomerase n=1 Tax=Pelosinus propionicus DSM 13327 TaxID=1123291 RepID=A0A1I4MQR5_9FIRM|nr:D-sedoheptulose 7-phosphate isomerase [Pelosinus propionicus]SFM05417.1 D-sedoheptulose 7-phosphate isomerase [Pelosinus propionicus DSM 13327]